MRIPLNENDSHIATQQHSHMASRRSTDLMTFWPWLAPEVDKINSRSPDLTFLALSPEVKTVPEVQRRLPK